MDEFHLATFEQSVCRSINAQFGNIFPISPLRSKACSAVNHPAWQCVRP